MNLQQLEALSDEQLRIKVAELLGIMRPLLTDGYERGWFDADGCIHFWCDDNSHSTRTKADNWPCPNYPNDLNACHEMEMAIPVGDELGVEVYPETLCDVVGCPVTSEDWKDEIKLIRATARQRCIAFLMTVGQRKK